MVFSRLLQSVKLAAYFQVSFSISSATSLVSQLELRCFSFSLTLLKYQQAASYAHTSVAQSSEQLPVQRDR